MTERSDVDPAAVAAVFGNRTWQTVTVEEFQGASQPRQVELIPNTPGLYLWTHNLNALVGESKRVIQQELKVTLGRMRKSRRTVLKPYYEIHVRDHRMEINDKRRLILRDALSDADPVGIWIADMATVFQRPLYAGMATKLRTRVRQHLGMESKLRTRLNEADIDMLTLAITWIEAPKIVAPDVTDEAEELEDDEEMPDEAADEDPQSDGSAANQEIDRVLKAAESLLIRLSMPMFNEVQT